MVEFGLFSHMALYLLDIYDVTPKLLNPQKGPLESTPKLSAARIRPPVICSPWPLVNITVDPKLPKCTI